MKFALHRSITFWSGLLVIVFICWVWWDSLSSHGAIGYWRCWIEESAGGAWLGYDSKLHIDLEGLRSDGPSNVVMDGPKLTARYWVKGTPPRSAWPQPLWGTNSSGFSVLLPFWLILLAAAVPWLGLLFWRSRRRAAAAKPLAEGERQA